jgi:hypothetical protein
MASHSPKTVNTGQKIVVGGLFVQIISFGLFVAVALVFHLRISKVPTARVLTESLPWKKHLIALYVSSALIMIRSIFRVAEFIQGKDGYLLGHEWFMYVFDTVLMLGVMALFCWIHPGEIRRYLGQGKHSQGENGGSGADIQLHQRLDSEVK